MSWVNIHIPAAAAAAGTVASVLTYTLLIQTTGGIATGTGWLLDGAGAVAAEGARLVGGDVPATSVRILGRVLSEGAATSLRSGGQWTSLGLAAAVGGTTAISVTLGSRLVEATVEYGSGLTKAVATRITDAYLRLKQDPASIDSSGSQIEFVETEREGDWILMDVAP